MWTLWRTLFIDEKTGLPWAVVLSMPWLRAVHTQVTMTEDKPQAVPKTAAPAAQATVKKSKVKVPAKPAKPAAAKPAAAKPAAKVAVKPATKASAKAAKPAAAKPAATKPAAKVAAKSAAKAPAKVAKPATAKPAVVRPTPKVAAKSARSTTAKLAVDGVLTVKAQNLITQITTSAPKAQIREGILLLCALREWTEITALAEALKHKPDQLETLHLAPMVKSGQLRLRPADAKHPEPAYGLPAKVL